MNGNVVWNKETRNLNEIDICLLEINFTRKEFQNQTSFLIKKFFFTNLKTHKASLIRNENSVKRRVLA